jgi:epoxyqueuosine reductase
MEMPEQELTIRALADGYPLRMVSIDHLPEIEQELRVRKESGLFDEGFYEERLSFFSFKIPNDLPKARSILVISMPSAQTPVKFQQGGMTLQLILPPTYRGYKENAKKMKEYLSQLLEPKGYRVVPARLPHKLLCVRSDLAEYGRNNITYIPGLGSFHQPTVLYSELPAREDAWCEPRMMERCQTCKACLVKCPTQAIAEDRFLLHAERCLVFHNERSGGHPFPGWINPRIHSSFMGCMICQQACPEDKPFLSWFEGGEEFNEEETGLLLKGARQEQLGVETVQKLGRLSLLDDLDKFPRNLGVFFNPIP